MLSTQPFGILDAMPIAQAVPPGTDLSAVLAQVRADGVSAPANEVLGLEAAVARAEQSGIHLSIVVIGQDQRLDSSLRDLATAVGTEEGGTVLVLSPGQVGSFSDSIDRVTLEAGQDRTYVGNPVVGADNFVDTITHDGPPWTFFTGVIMLVVLAAAGATSWAKIRRRPKRVAAVPSGHASTDTAQPTN